MKKEFKRLYDAQEIEELKRRVRRIERMIVNYHLQDVLRADLMSTDISSPCYKCTEREFKDVKRELHKDYTAIMEERVKEIEENLKK